MTAKSSFMAIRLQRGIFHAIKVVFFYVSSNFEYMVFQDPVYDQTHLQCIWMEIIPPKSKGFILSSCYRPPDVDNEQAYVAGLRNMLTEVADCGKEIVMAKFPHSPILHYACGSMCVVLCFATKK